MNKKKLRTRVLCVELNKEFESIKEAARYMDGDPSNLRACLQGRWETFCGYHWKVLEVIYQEHPAKEDCFAYLEKPGGYCKCRALKTMRCAKEECSFYKPKNQVPANIYADLDFDNLDED